MPICLEVTFVRFKQSKHGMFQVKVASITDNISTEQGVM